MDNNHKPSKRLLCKPTDGTQGAEFVRRFAPQFEATLHTIQDKYASLYGHLSGTGPASSPGHPHPGTAPAGTRSQATPRIDALPLAEHYSDLTLMGVEGLRDQLKKHKLLGKTGFALSLPNRTAYVLQLQTLLLEENANANDRVEDGDAGIDRCSVRRRATVRGQILESRCGLRSYMGYE
eukprot:6184800-Pleurochrysis_carterae.AAC.1